MSSAESLWDAFFLMMILIFIAIVLLFAVAIPGDNIIPVMQAAGTEDVSAQWDTFDDREYVQQLIYIVDYALVIIGVGNFIITAARRQRYDLTTYYR